jgi:hypothetical protein
LKKKEKKMGLKSYRKKPNEDEIKKNVLQIKKIAIKKIRSKLERLKHYGGEI